MKEVPSLGQVYETILRRPSLPMPGFEEEFQEKALGRATRIHNYLFVRADRLGDDCLLCEKKKARGSQTRYVYETPWEDGETEKHFAGRSLLPSKSGLLSLRAGFSDYAPYVL